MLQEVTKLFLDSYVLLNPKQCNQQIYDEYDCVIWFWDFYCFV